MSDDNATAEVLALVRDFLLRRCGGAFARTIAALDEEASAGGSRTLPSCPPDQLRRLLHRALSNDGGLGLLGPLPMDGVDSEPRPIVALPSVLCQREHGAHGVARCGPARAIGARTSAELVVGSARLGLRGVLEGHTSAAFCVCFDPSGERCFTGADDHLVKVWDTRTCYALRTLRGHRNEITDLAVHASGSHLASASNDCTVRIWELGASGMPCIAVLQAMGGAAAASPMIAACWRALSTLRPAHQVLTFTSSGHSTLWSRLPPPPPPTQATADAPVPRRQRQTRRAAIAPSAEPLAGASSSAAGAGAQEPSGPAPAASGGGGGGEGTDGVLHGWACRSMQLHVKEAQGFEVFTAAWSKGGVRIAVSTSDCVAYVLRVAGEQECKEGGGGGSAGVPVCVATLRSHQHDVTSLVYAAAASPT